MGEEERGVGHQARGVIDEGEQIRPAHLPRIVGVREIRPVFQISLPELIAVRFLEAACPARDGGARTAGHHSSSAQEPVERGARHRSRSDQLFLLQNLQDGAHTAGGQFFFERDGGIQHVRRHGLDQATIPAMPGAEGLQPAGAVVLQPAAHGACREERHAVRRARGQQCATACGGLRLRERRLQEGRDEQKAAHCLSLLGRFSHDGSPNRARVRSGSVSGASTMSIRLRGPAGG